jgi:hypothetical protein
LGWGGAGEEDKADEQTKQILHLVN